MRTARSLTMVGRVYLPGGCTCTGGVPAWGGTCPAEYLPQGTCSGGCTCLGVYLPGWEGTCLGGGVPAQVLPPPPWTEFVTHATENITLPQLRCGR